MVFTIVDGELVIHPIPVAVTVAGLEKTFAYDGTEKTVTGYETVSISSDLYTAEDYTLADGAEASVSAILVGEYPMGLTEDSFVNLNSDFTDVTFIVTDGILWIEGEKVEVAKTEVSVPPEIGYLNGTDITFEITVKNITDHDQLNVEVTDPSAILQPAAGITVSSDGHKAVIGVVPSGETVTVTAIHNIVDLEIIRAYYRNLSTVVTEEREYPADAVESKLEPLDMTLTVIVTDDVADQTYPELGEEINYTLFVKNEGNVTYYDIVVKDDQTGFETVIDVLKPGESMTFYPDAYIVTEEDIRNKLTIEKATAIAADLDPEYPGKIPMGEGQDIVAVAEPVSDVKITIAITNAPQNRVSFDADERIYYRITVINTGNQTLNDAVIKTQLNNINGVRVEGIDATVKGNTIILNEGLLPTQQITINCGYTVLEKDLGTEGENGRVNNNATITATTLVPAEVIASSNTVTAKTRILLTVTALDSLQNVWTGEEFGGIGAIAETLAEGDILSDVTVTGTAADINFYEDLLVPSDAVILDAEDNDVTDHYHIVYENGDLEIIPPHYQLIIRYWIETIGGKTAAETYVRDYNETMIFAVRSPFVPGYTPDVETVNGMIMSDLVIDVVYHVNTYTLTVHYVDVNGEQLADDVVNTLTAGSSYNVTSPVIDGYQTNMTEVTGVMPGSNVEVTVVYLKKDEPRQPIYTTIEDYNVPRGIGGGGCSLGEMFD